MSRVMKDSGVEWIGELPKNWEVFRIGYHFECRNAKVNDTEWQPLSVTKNGIVPQLDSAAKTTANDDRMQVIKGDFVINSRSDRKQSCGLSEYDGSVSLINIVLHQKRGSTILPEYTRYLLNNYGFAEEFYRWGNGIVADLWSTRWELMKRISIPLPSLVEQKAIFEYINIACSRIDHLISLQAEMIAELQAYKQSVITEVVTKGLDPNVPMKDSGVEWIGYIPEDAKVVSVARLYSSILGKMVCDTPANDSDTLEPYLCAINVHFDGIDLSTLKAMWFSENEKQKYLLKNGDLLIVEGGAGAGGAAIVDIADNRDLYIQNSIHLVRAYKGLAANKYLYYNLYSLVKRFYIDFVCNKATIPHFTKEKLKETPIVYFPLGTQLGIINYLDKKCQSIDAMISLKQQKIESLREYKKSLIYECVTGKREVV